MNQGYNAASVFPIVLPLPVLRGRAGVGAGSWWSVEDSEENAASLDFQLSFPLHTFRPLPNPPTGYRERGQKFADSILKTLTR
jgi:hypothetical protein